MSLIITAIGLLAVSGASLFWFFRKPGSKDKSKDQKSAESISADSESSGDEADLEKPLRVRIGIAVHAVPGKVSRGAFGLAGEAGKLFEQKGLLAVIAEGFGEGDFAGMAVEQARESFENDDPEIDDEKNLLNTFIRVQEKISAEETNKGGTSYTSVLIHNSQLHFLSVGTGRIFLYRGGGLIPLNRETVIDKNLNSFLTGGHLNPDENALTKAISESKISIRPGAEPSPDRNIRPVNLVKGDMIAMVAGNVSAVIPDSELAKGFSSDPEAAAEAIRDLYVRRSGDTAEPMALIVLAV